MDSITWIRSSWVGTSPTRWSRRTTPFRLRRVVPPGGITRYFGRAENQLYAELAGAFTGVDWSTNPVFEVAVATSGALKFASAATYGPFRLLGPGDLKAGTLSHRRHRDPRGRLDRSVLPRACRDPDGLRDEQDHGAHRLQPDVVRRPDHSAVPATSGRPDGRAASPPGPTSRRSLRTTTTNTVGDFTFTGVDGGTYVVVAPNTYTSPGPR